MAERPFEFAPIHRDLRLRYPPQWPAIIFFGTMAFLHCANAAPALLHGRLEAELSIILAIGFTFMALGFRLVRSELTVRPSNRDLRLTRRFIRVWTERTIPFDHVISVRLFMPGRTTDKKPRIEILCIDESIDWPETPIPRQQALYLAITMGVELIKICPDAQANAAERS
jgi:hypothetical protein